LWRPLRWQVAQERKMKLEFEFDSDEGNRRKIEGMKRAASIRKSELEEGRKLADKVARIVGIATID
jgi:hypothetical protein